MFSDVTKTTVVSSSHVKGVGPRIGSIGYASSYGAAPHPSRFLPLNNQFITGLILTALRVAFIRYGYEKGRPKYEVKNILGVVPIVNELKKVREVEDILRTFIEKFPKTNFSTHNWLSNKIDLVNKTDNIEVCILAPIKSIESDLRTCSHMEFCAWFNTFMNLDRNKVGIWRMVSKDNLVNRLHNREMTDYARLLRMYFSSKSDADDLINYISKDLQRRTLMLKLIRALKSTYSRKMLIDHQTDMSRLLLEGRYNYRKGSKALNNLYCKLAEFMFIDEIFNAKMDILKNSKGLKNKDLISNKFKRTKEVLESIGDEINER